MGGGHPRDDHSPRAASQNWQMGRSWIAAAPPAPTLSRAPGGAADTGIRTRMGSTRRSDANGVTPSKSCTEVMFPASRAASRV